MGSQARPQIPGRAKRAGEQEGYLDLAYLQSPACSPLPHIHNLSLGNSPPPAEEAVRGPNGSSLVPLQ